MITSSAMINAANWTHERRRREGKSSGQLPLVYFFFGREFATRNTKTKVTDSLNQLRAVSSRDFETCSLSCRCKFFFQTNSWKSTQKLFEEIVIIRSTLLIQFERTICSNFLLRCWRKQFGDKKTSWRSCNHWEWSVSRKPMSCFKACVWEFLFLRLQIISIERKFDRKKLSA